MTLGPYIADTLGRVEEFWKADLSTTDFYI